MRTLDAVRALPTDARVSIDERLVDVAANLVDLARPVTAEIFLAHHATGLPLSR